MELKMEEKRQKKLTDKERVFALKPAQVNDLVCFLQRTLQLAQEQKGFTTGVIETECRHWLKICEDAKAAELARNLYKFMAEHPLLGARSDQDQYFAPHPLLGEFGLQEKKLRALADQFVNDEARMTREGLKENIRRAITPLLEKQGLDIGHLDPAIQEASRRIHLVPEITHTVDALMTVIERQPKQNSMLSQFQLSKEQSKKPVASFDRKVVPEQGEIKSSCSV